MPRGRESTGSRDVIQLGFLVEVEERKRDDRHPRHDLVVVWCVDPDSEMGWGAHPPSRKTRVARERAELLQPACAPRRRMRGRIRRHAGARVLPGERTRPRVPFSAPSRTTGVARARAEFLRPECAPRRWLRGRSQRHARARVLPASAISVPHFTRATTLARARRRNNEFTAGPHSLLARCDF